MTPVDCWICYVKLPKFKYKVRYPGSAQKRWVHYCNECALRYNVSLGLGYDETTF